MRACNAARGTHSAVAPRGCPEQGGPAALVCDPHTHPLSQQLIAQVRLASAGIGRHTGDKTRRIESGLKLEPFFDLVGIG